MLGKRNLSSQQTGLAQTAVPNFSIYTADSKLVKQYLRSKFTLLRSATNYRLSFALNA